MPRPGAVVSAHDLAVEGMTADGANRRSRCSSEIAIHWGLQRIGGSCRRLRRDTGRSLDGSLDRGRGDVMRFMPEQRRTGLEAADAAENLAGMIQNITFHAELR